MVFSGRPVDEQNDMYGTDVYVNCGFPLYTATRSILILTDASVKRIRSPDGMVFSNEKVTLTHKVGSVLVVVIRLRMPGYPVMRVSTKDPISSSVSRRPV